MPNVRSLVFIAGLLLAPSSLAAEPVAAGEPAASAALRTFADWKTGCDNLRNCTAIGLPPRGEETVGYIVVRRGGAPHAPPRVSLKMASELPFKSPATLSIKVDDAPVAGLSRASWPAAITDTGTFVAADIDGPDAQHLLRYMSAGKTLRVLVTGEGRKPETGTLSLSGIVAAFTHLDAVQHRTGTVTALITPGTAPADGIPAVPPMPVLAALRMEPLVPAPETLPAGVTPPDLDDCAGSIPPVPLVIRVSPRLTLWGICYVRGSYNEQSTFWLVGDGTPRQVAFPLPDGLSWTDGPSILENPNVSEDRLALQSNPRGRGAGDCGAAISWVWTRTDFRLASLSQMDECRGVRSEDWPVTYITHRARDAAGMPHLDK